jgi:hypothetical protein
MKADAMKQVWGELGEEDSTEPFPSKSTPMMFGEMIVDDLRNTK